MTVPGAIKPNHKAVKAYYEALTAYADQASGSVGEEPLECRLGGPFFVGHGKMLIPQLPIKRRGKHSPAWHQ